jgi:hypothetical protein
VDVRNALKNVYSDPRWQIRQIRSKWHRYAEIDGVKVGIVFATNNKPEYHNFALNCAHLERLRDGRAVGKVDRAFVVGSMTNGCRPARISRSRRRGGALRKQTSEPDADQRHLRAVLVAESG